MVDLAVLELDDLRIIWVGKDLYDSVMIWKIPKQKSYDCLLPYSIFLVCSFHTLLIETMKIVFLMQKDYHCATQISTGQVKYPNCFMKLVDY